MIPLPPHVVCAVSSRHRLAPDARTTRTQLAALEAWIDILVGAGVDLLQLREPDLGAAALCAVATRAVRLAAGTATQVIVNDRADVALAAGAHGVHLPAKGFPAEAVQLLNAAWVIGRSLHPVDPPSLAAGCDYAIFGSVFETRSKPGSQPAGLEALRAASSRLTCPVLAVGGVTPARVPLVLDAGATGVAAIGAFLPAGLEADALGPAEATAEFRRALRP